MPRRYFLTFKGTIYLSGRTPTTDWPAGAGVARRNLLTLHDPSKGIIILGRCFTNHGEHKLPEHANFCAKLESRWNDYTYDDLLNSTFALVPAGRSPATFRLAETMSAGSIPIIVAHDYTRPFQDHVPWDDISLLVKPGLEHTIVPRLQVLTQERIRELRKAVLKHYDSFLGLGIPEAIIRVLHRRILSMRLTAADQ